MYLVPGLFERLLQLGDRQVAELDALFEREGGRRARGFAGQRAGGDIPRLRPCVAVREGDDAPRRRRIMRVRRNCGMNGIVIIA